jgi:multidrug resistance protein, MATE family
MLESYKTSFRKTFLLAYPVVISQLGHMIVNLTDVLFIGKLGAIPLAACSLGISFFVVFMVFGIGISYGMTPLIAQHHGAKENDQCGVVLSNGLLINIIAGLLFAGMIYGLSPLLYRLNQNPEVIKQTMPFLHIIGFSTIPMMLFLTFKQFAEGLSFTRQAMIITLSADAINVFLTLCLINGYLGFPMLGLIGAGWANFISRCIMALAMMIYVFKSHHFKPYLHQFKRKVISYKESITIISLGIPTALQYLFEVGAFAFAAVMIGWLGPDYQAAHQIAINMASITYMAASGIGAAATIRVGNAVGEKNYLQLRRSGITSYIMVIIFMGFNAVLFIIGNTFFPSFYINDHSVVQIASLLVIIAAFFQLSDGAQVVGLGALRGMNDVKIPTIITLLAYWVLGIPLGYYMGFELGMGVEGVWYALLIGLSVAALLLFLRFNYFTKKMIRLNQTIIKA